MEIPGNLMIIVGIVIVVLGVFAGLLLSTLREDAEPEAEDEDPAPPGGKPGKYDPVTRLWREKGTGRLVVEIDGRAFISAEPLDAGQRDRLDRVARDLRTWLGTGQPVADPAEALRAAVPPQAQVTPPAPIPAAPETPAVQPQPEQIQPRPAPAPYEPPPAAVYPAQPAPAAASGKSIVMQIEDILQEMIAGTPLARRGLHLLEDPSRGVMVQLGPNLYEGIDSVPEPDVQATIRAAVAEWEKSQ